MNFKNLFAGWAPWATSRQKTDVKEGAPVKLAKNSYNVLAAHRKAQENGKNGSDGSNGDQAENRLVRKLMHQYFVRKEWGYETSITYVKTSRERDGLTVEAETHKPGLLIGKSGHFIDGLTAHLKENLKENVKINIKECKMWQDL